MTVEGLQQIGFRLLAKREDREIVLGLIGKFWTSSAGILPFQPEEFVSFDSKEYAKAAGNLLAVPITSHRTRLITETSGSMHLVLESCSLRSLLVTNQTV
jgi:hypothetical protein